MLQSVTKFLGGGGTSASNAGPDYNDTEDDDVDFHPLPFHAGSSNADSLNMKKTAIVSKDL